MYLHPTRLSTFYCHLLLLPAPSLFFSPDSLQSFLGIIQSAYEQVVKRGLPTYLCLRLRSSPYVESSSLSPDTRSCCTRVCTPAQVVSFHEGQENALKSAVSLRLCWRDFPLPSHSAIFSLSESCLSLSCYTDILFLFLQVKEVIERHGIGKATVVPAQVPIAKVNFLPLSCLPRSFSTIPAAPGEAGGAKVLRSASPWICPSLLGTDVRYGRLPD